jgi:hypothetical protein
LQAQVQVVFKQRLVIADPRHSVSIPMKKQPFGAISLFQPVYHLMGDISHMASEGTYKSMVPARIGYMAGCWLVTAEHVAGRDCGHGTTAYACNRWGNA